MQKKVIFMMINMNIGGTERAFLNMIAEMPESEYDITLLMLEKYGGFLESIPKRIRTKYLDEYKNMKDVLNQPPKDVIIKLLKQCRLIKCLFLSYVYLISKITKNRSILFKYLLKDYPMMINEYDTAIAYAGPMDFISYFVVHKIKANNKIQWIHFDVNEIGFNKAFASETYKYFNQIYAVSNEGKNKLGRILPHLHNKIDIFFNEISSKELHELANNDAGFTDDFDGMRILTVGRLSLEKGQDLIIPVMAKLKKKGFKVWWYCIGEGNARKDYEELISVNNIENEFILMGSKINPYPFMKQCDIYVQPSRHEGYCMTLAEAKIFDKPIICTNFTGATEQIIDGKSGIVVKFDEGEMVEALTRLITNSQIRDKFTSNLEKERQNLISTSRKII